MNASWFHVRSLLLVTERNSTRVSCDVREGVINVRERQTLLKKRFPRLGRETQLFANHIRPNDGKSCPSTLASVVCHPGRHC